MQNLVSKFRNLIPRMNTFILVEVKLGSVVIPLAPCLMAPIQIAINYGLSLTTKMADII